MTIFPWHAQENNQPPLSLTSRKNSASLDLAIFDVLDINLLAPLRCIKVLQGPIIFSSNIKIDIRDIYPSLNIIRVRLHFRPLHKRTKLMNYKYPMRPLKQRFTIFILYYIYIYIYIYTHTEHLSLEYSCIFSLQKYTYLNIRESSPLPNKIFCRY